MDRQARTASSGRRQPNTNKLPADFWTQLEIQQACRERHFGRLLKSWRELQDPPVKQSELATTLGVTQGQVSRIERNPQPPHNLSKLISWAKTLDIPESILWFNFDDSDSTACAFTNAPDRIGDDDTSEEDIRRRELFKTIGVGAALLGTDTLQESIPAVGSNYNKVGMESVEVMREYARMFRRLDNRFGGGHSLKQLVYYLRTEVQDKLTDTRASSTVSYELFSTAAELYHLAGWMSYDIGESQQGHRALTQALALSQQVGNQVYAAELLAGMSHQFSHFRDPDNAIDRALTAKNGAKINNVPALTAEAAVMAAHGYAQEGDRRNCIINLQEAEAAYARIRPDDTPDWLGYLDSAYLSAKFGHALKDLGEPAQAERFARQSLHMSDGYDRGRMFNTALLASVLADQGNIDEAVPAATEALQLASNVRSVRSKRYLSDVAQRLQPYKSSTHVQQLFKQMTTHQIPLQRV
ncbi:helix-turn-helix transcriptional regulator [Haloechinothrix sp. LS1_15]|uniref:helix-turn-helix domain-containing protein n=1 Tax=Haloechinothrix sp. LS1_15 TaxID=2652248 RepID=UPI002946435C|nr:helix-turn-helix transcriptional regulator [Haloechinothrix sp. LS1_15]MDV6012113.1 helix-turn-helix transcriptional regulator [Haloechinothrix sp. LS1_15]